MRGVLTQWVALIFVAIEHVELRLNVAVAHNDDGILFTEAALGNGVVELTILAVLLELFEPEAFRLIGL